MVLFKKYAKLVLGNLLVIVLLLTLIELALSFFVAREIDHNITQHPILNHIRTPNTAKVFTRFIEGNPRFPDPFTQRYNAQGWVEDYDISLNKAPNMFRIFYVGDSFIEGPMKKEQNLPSLVNTFLQKKYANSATKIEVINAGTTSYSPILYYILIRHYISKYAPDLIVVNVDMTDDYDDDKYRETLKVDKYGNPSAAPPRNIFKAAYVDTETGKIKMGLREKLHLWLYLNSNFYYITVPNMQKWLGSKPTSTTNLEEFYHRWQWMEGEWDDRTTEKVAFSMDILGRLSDYCLANNIKLLLTGVPHYSQMQYDEHGKRVSSIRPHQEIEKVAKAKKVAYFDSVAALEAKVQGSAPTAYYYYQDMHFNPAGNVLWSQAHIAALQDTIFNLLLPIK